MKKYVPADGAHITPEQAQRYGEFIAKVADDYNGVKPEYLVDLRSSPAISDWFENSQKKAAEKYWKVQAYELLRQIHVVMELPDGEVTTVRAFHPITVNVITEKGEPREPQTVKVYKQIYEVLSDSDMRAEMLDQALEEFRYMRNKYRHFKELSSIFDAIDDQA
jgi:hypothetical protein